MGIPLPIIPHT
jgi:hypothetical protein